MYRLAYVVSHPVQYQAPLLRRIASERDIELKVFFLSDVSLHEHYEPAFRHAFRWDVPLTEGYDWEALFGGGGSRLWTAKGLKNRLRAGNFDAVWIHGWGRIGLVQAITAAHSLDLPILLRGESTPDVRLGTLRAHVRNWFLQWLLRLVSAFLCIGSLNRQFYRLRGISENKLFSVPYA